jgi:hypothetical protein
MYDVDPLVLKMYLRELERRATSQARVVPLPEPEAAARSVALEALARALLRLAQALRPAQAQ